MHGYVLVQNIIKHVNVNLLHVEGRDSVPMGHTPIGNSIWRIDWSRD